MRRLLTSLSISAALARISVPGRKYSIVAIVGRPCENARTSMSGNLWRSAHHRHALSTTAVESTSVPSISKRMAEHFSSKVPKNIFPLLTVT